jgi:hypothetical protein
VDAGQDRPPGRQFNRRRRTLQRRRARPVAESRRSLRPWCQRAVSPAVSWGSPRRSTKRLSATRRMRPQFHDVYALRQRAAKVLTGLQRPSLPGPYPPRSGNRYGPMSCWPAWLSLILMPSGQKMRDTTRAHPAANMVEGHLLPHARHAPATSASAMARSGLKVTEVTRPCPWPFPLASHRSWPPRRQRIASSSQGRRRSLSVRSGPALTGHRHNPAAATAYAQITDRCPPSISGATWPASDPPQRLTP